MKVLLIKDVYNLGRAGEVKKVADGYARNFLLPQKLAVMATGGAVKQVEKIKAAAAKQRELLNAELSELSGQIDGLELSFTAKVGETGRLYGSITQQMIVDAINEKIHVNVDRHQVESQPLREVGDHIVKVRLTYDLIPEVKVTVMGEEKDEEEAPVKDKDKRSKKSKPQADAAEPSAEEIPAAEVVQETAEESADEA